MAWRRTSSSHSSPPSAPSSNARSPRCASVASAGAGDGDEERDDDCGGGHVQPAVGWAAPARSSPQNARASQPPATPAGEVVRGNGDEQKTKWLDAVHGG
uniref:Uncharacterized protein n=1 Tax=Oryza glumipatula TaxID=40148 RepID=A0A0E0BLJ7_9ORYZ